jgi:hypothetical protein
MKYSILLVVGDWTIMAEAPSEWNLKNFPLSFQTINMVFGVFHLYLHLTHLGHIFFPSTTTTIISTRRSWKRFINYLISNPLHLPNLCMYSPKYLGSTLALHFQSNPICSIKYTRICLNALMPSYSRIATWYHIDMPKVCMSNFFLSPITYLIC